MRGRLRGSCKDHGDSTCNLVQQLAKQVRNIVIQAGYVIILMLCERVWVPEATYNTRISYQL
jgi:hypothetical protein